MIAFVVFFHGIGIPLLSISRPAVLLVHKWFTGQFFASGCSVFLELITAAQFYRFSCAIFPWF
jgi:uncharacterized membrane protein YwaF